MNELRTFRVRAGLYYSVDGYWEIRRTLSMFGKRKYWRVRRLAIDGGGSRVEGEFPTLTAARNYVWNRYERWA